MDERSQALACPEESTRTGGIVFKQRKQLEISVNKLSYTKEILQPDVMTASRD
jgi:hypothetical protein